MARCTMSEPCGAITFPDRAFNRDMETYGLPQRRYCCLAGHSLMVGVPAGQPAPARPVSAPARKAAARPPQRRLPAA